MVFSSTAFKTELKVKSPVERVEYYNVEINDSELFYPVFYDKTTKYGRSVKGKIMISNTKEVQSEIVL